MGVELIRKTELDIYCSGCGEQLTITREEDYGDTFNVYVNPCSKCNSIDVSDTV